MSLIKCQECNKEISDKAKFCVHCGYVETKSIFVRELGFDGQVFILVVTIGIILTLGGVFAFTQNFFVGVSTISAGFSLMISGTIMLLLRSLN